MFEWVVRVVPPPIYMYPLRRIYRLSSIYTCGLGGYISTAKAASTKGQTQGLRAETSLRCGCSCDIVFENISCRLEPRGNERAPVETRFPARSPAAPQNFHLLPLGAARGLAREFA